MKKMICIILVLMLALTGCQGAPGETTPPTETMAPTEAAQPQEMTMPTLPETTFNPGPVLGGLEGDELPFENAGKVRLTYDGVRSFVRYVTSVDQLPQEGNWEGYDEAYFENKALLIVVDTLASGSIQVDLESVTVDEGIATVTLKRTLAGEVGTADMATWLLWAEVEKGLEYTWLIKDRPQEPVGEKY